jgi:nitrite reductase/ring-hydroxylating ferredoxin subunit
MAAAPEPLHWREVPHAPAIGTVLGHLDNLVDGQVTMHALESLDRAASDNVFRFLLLRSGYHVSAYVNRCAHFGVPLAARQELLIFQPHTSVSCNVHYARYRWSDGMCISGDCEGERLLQIPVHVDALGTICIAETP